MPAENPRALAQYFVPLIMRLNTRIADEAAAQLRPQGAMAAQPGVLVAAMIASQLGRPLFLTSNTMNRSQRQARETSVPVSLIRIVSSYRSRRGRESRDMAEGG